MNKYCIYILCMVAIVSSKPEYYPNGPQLAVPESALTGWKLCWQDTYNTVGEWQVNQVYSTCSGTYLLYGCRPTDSDNFTVLAVGNAAVVTLDSGSSITDGFHIDNGVAWYWSDGYSIGFFSEGDEVIRDQCDVLGGETRVCWHTGGGGVAKDFIAGWRCGDKQNILSTDWRREIWVPNDPCESLTEGDVCDDLNVCTTDTTCNLVGECTGTAVTCGECERCDVELGCVTAFNGTACNDGSSCTQTDTCQAGVCIGTNPVVCTTDKQCFNSTCDPSTGSCADSPITDCVPSAAPIGTDPPESTPASAPVSTDTPISEPASAPGSTPKSAISEAHSLVVFGALVPLCYFVVL